MDVRKVNDFYFVDEDGVMVDWRHTRAGQKCYLRGIFEDQVAAFMGTKYCQSSFVENVSESGEVTTKNTTYQLGEMSPDYREFLEVTKSGIRYVGDWNLYGDEKQYFLTGNCFPEQKAVRIAKIISQDGNFLLVQWAKETPSKEIAWDEMERVFVCWNSMSKNAERKIYDEGKVADDILYENFQNFGGLKCKPVFK